MKYPEFTELTENTVAIDRPDYKATVKELDLNDWDIIQEDNDDFWYFVTKCPRCDDGIIYSDYSEANGNLVESTKECTLCDENCHVDLMIAPCIPYPLDFKRRGIASTLNIIMSVNDDINE